MGTAVLVVVAVALVLLYALGRRRKTGRERSFLSVPRQFRFFDYRSVIVGDERGTTEIDVIVVGNAGVFVVEMKEYNAWIFGDENDEKWTACYLDKSKHQFQNPIRQNFRHIKALQTQLGLPHELFKSIVAFTGNCEFKTPMPSNVIVGDYRDLIERADGIMLPDSEVKRVCQVLEALESASTNDAFDAHVSELKSRHSSTTICPKCGAPLVERRSTKSTSDGAPFLGCRAFPRCTYTKRIDAT